MTLRTAPILVIASLLAACAPVAPVATPADAIPQSDTCGAARVASHLGMPATATRRAMVEQESGAGRVRWLPPGSIVTLDYSPERLNVELDEENRIIRYRCV